MPKLYCTVGLPASGKSSYARGRVTKDKKLHRYCYDDFRQMMHQSIFRDINTESVVRTVCRESVRTSLREGFDVIIDNTCLTEGAQDSWRNLAKECKAGFEIVDFRKVPVETCIGRDNLRSGSERVSPPVIWNMALQAGLMKFDHRKIVIVDVDGTLADCAGVRNPYDETLVHLDNTRDVVVQWAKNLVHEDESYSCFTCYHHYNTHTNIGTVDEFDCPVLVCTKPGCDCVDYWRKGVQEYQVIIVSGRSTLCSLSTYNWLVARGIPFEAVFMRNRGDNRPDVEVKQEILDRLLKVVPKEQIVFVLDDRPSVCRMWKSNGLTVYPVRGAVEEF